MFTEFGADAFNAVENGEDQQPQAYYMVSNWKEIYENAAGLGKSGNSIGGVYRSSSATDGGSLVRQQTLVFRIIMPHGQTAVICMIMWQVRTI